MKTWVIMICVLFNLCNSQFKRYTENIPRMLSFLTPRLESQLGSFARIIPYLASPSQRQTLWEVFLRNDFFNLQKSTFLHSVKGHRYLEFCEADVSFQGWWASDTHWNIHAGSHIHPALSPHWDLPVYLFPSPFPLLVHVSLCLLSKWAKCIHSYPHVSTSSSNMFWAVYLSKALARCLEVLGHDIQSSRDSCQQRVLPVSPHCQHTDV